MPWLMTVRLLLGITSSPLKTRLKLDSRSWCRQRWLIIYNALVEPREARDIAKHTGTIDGITVELTGNLQKRL